MKTITTFAMLLLFSITVYCQDWSASVYQVGKIYPGYIIKTNGEKTEGYLQAQERASYQGGLYSNQNRVIFYTNPKDKSTKVIYKPEDLKEYQIAEKVYKSMNYSGGITDKPIRFVLQNINGCLSEYIWYTDNNNQWEAKYVMQKGDEQPIGLISISLKFAEKMSEIVSDDTELATKIKSKENGYSFIQIEKIINEYNTWCNNKQ